MNYACVICFQTNVVAQHAIHKLTARGGATGSKTLYFTITFYIHLKKNNVLLFTMN